jgi:hypothetical protein
MQEHLVAFIDILGFGAQVKAASTPQDFAQILAKLASIQEAFQKPSASKKPKEQQAVNQRYGKLVLALSDAVLIATNFDCEARETLNANDAVGWLVYELIQGQYECVLKHGIFLRGGLGVGPFMYHNDLLVSPGLVEAHDLETHYANAPVVALCQATFDWVKATAKGDSGFPNWKEAYFQPLENRRGQERLYFLDYLGVALTDDEDPTNVLRRHRQLIVAAYGAANNDSVKSKYRWLMTYHNDTIKRICPEFSSCAIDLAQHP